MSPTARTLAELRKHGFTAEVVEKTVPHTFIKVDFIGVVDIIAFSPAHGILAVQTSDGSNHAKRRAKILAEPRAAKWLASGGRLEIWSWAVQGAAGTRKRWMLRVETILAGDIKSGDIVPTAPAVIPDP